MTKKYFLGKMMIASCATMLAGCGPSTSTMFYKVNVPVVQKQDDVDACKIASFKVIPQVVKTEVTQGSYSEGYVSCSSDKASSCSLVGGSYTPGSSYSVDMNRQMRERYVDKCLAQKGYKKLTLPNCKDGVERQKALNVKNAAELTCNPDPALDL